MRASQQGRSPVSLAGVTASAPRILLALVPAAMIVYFGFRAGGFFVGATAGVALFLLLLLAGRLALTPLVAEGLNRTVLIAIAGMVLFSLWTWLSGRWSHAPARALVEFDRALVYTAALIVFGLARTSPRRLRAMVRGLALAAVIVCAAGLITRLAPDIWPLERRSASPRLSYPITYWNAFALLAAIGITMCFGLTSNEREMRIVRVLSAAAIPILASALLLTASRGGVAAAAVGVLLFAVIGHTRGLVSGLLAAVPTTAIAMSSTYGAELLLTKDPSTLLTAAAQAQGHRVAAVVALCALAAGLIRGLLLYVDDVLVQMRPSKAVRRQVLGAGAITVAVMVFAAGAAVDAPGKFDAFISPGQVEAADTGTGSSDDLRTRLTNITDNGRIAFWTVSMDGFKANPLQGTGAATFAHEWEEKRSTNEDVLDAHGLYAEVLGELGLVGLGLLVTTILAILIGVARRIRGQYRALFATIFAALFAWVVAAGFDWHWEMPVVTAWFFALGAAAIASPRKPTPPTRFLGTLPRIALVIPILVIITLVPVRLIISQDRLETTLIAYELGLCDQVAVFSKESLDAVGSRPEPWEFRAGCELQEDRPREAILALKEAIARDPDTARLHLSLASAQALAGRDARLELARAARLNPRDKSLRHIRTVFADLNEPAEWKQAARRLNLRVVTPTI